MTELSDFELFVLICSTDKINSKVTAVLEVAFDFVCICWYLIVLTFLDDSSAHVQPISSSCKFILLQELTRKKL